MIIPVRCFTCNNMIGDKWNPYIELVRREKAKSKQNISEDLDIDYIEVDKGADVADFYIVERLPPQAIC